MTFPARAFKTMNAYCVANYGHGLLAVDSTCALWVAEHFGGRKNWETIRNARERAGKHMFFPAYGSICWT